MSLTAHELSDFLRRGKVGLSLNTIFNAKLNARLKSPDDNEDAITTTLTTTIQSAGWNSTSSIDNLFNSFA